MEKNYNHRSFVPPLFQYQRSRPAKLCALFIAVLLCICSTSLSAKSANKFKNKAGRGHIGRCTKGHGLSTKSSTCPAPTKQSVSGPPTLSYGGAQTYTQGAQITPLTPTGSGVAAPGYAATAAVLASSDLSLSGLAVDSKGDVFVGNDDGGIYELPGGTGSAILIGTVSYYAYGLAVDAQGNVYVANGAGNMVQELPFVNATYGAPITLGSGFTFSEPLGVAVDNEGNVYVADNGNNAVVEIPVGGGAVFTIGSGFSDPAGVAVDAYGNVYVADYGNNAIKEIPAGNGKVITLGSGFNEPTSVGVDGTGNVFLIDSGNGLVKEIPVGNGTPVSIGPGNSGGPTLLQYGIAIDNANNVYEFYGNSLENTAVNIIKPLGGYYISPALPQGLSINNTTGAISGTPAAASPATTYTVTAYNQSGSTSATVNITVNLPPPPTLSYSSPQAYAAGTAITPLAPTASNVAAPAYATMTTSLGSGFNLPADLAVDSKGNVFVADQNNNLVKEIPGGTGTPIVIGTGFNQPTGVAVDGTGNVYVSNAGNNLVQEVPFANGAYGPPVTLGSGFSFNAPFSVAVDTNGNVYVADYGNSSVEEIPVGGGAVFTIGSGFSTPSGVAVDAYGNVYVADYGNSAVKEIPAGNGPVITLGSGIKLPFTVAVDGTGNVFLTDSGNLLVKEIPVGNGTPVSIGGTGFSLPWGTAVDNANNVYVTDYTINAVEKIQPIGGYYISPALPLGLSFNNTTGAISGTPLEASPATAYAITAYNLNGSKSTTVTITVNAVTMSYAGPQTYTEGATITPLSPTGSGAVAPGYANRATTLGSGFGSPQGLAADSKGNVFVADAANSQIKEIPGGTGTPIVIGTNFYGPEGIAVDAQGNLYVADTGNNLIKEIPLNGTYGAPVVLGADFTFRNPTGVAIDSKGNVYVADQGHSAVDEIPANSSTAVVIGSGFSNPYGVAVDAYGNVYVADSDHSAIKEIPAGNGAVIILGSGFKGPIAVAVDGTGNLFLTDTGNQLVKEIPAGNGTPVSIGGTGFNQPFGIAVDRYNSVYVTDVNNNTVQKIQPIGGYYISPELPLGLSFNNATGTISGTPTAASPATNYTITAYNRYGSNSTTVNVKVTANTNLSGLAISNGTLSPPFSSATGSYKVNVGNGTTAMTVTPTAADPAATIMVNGAQVNSGTASQSIPLAVGANIITIQVLGQDGVSSNTYTVAVTRAPSTDAYLSNLTVQTATLSPGFAFKTFSYMATVPNTTTSVTVTPALLDPTAKIKVNGTTVANKAASGAIALAPGVNTISIVITAQDGITTQTYTLTITRTPLTIATLSNLKINAGTLSPAFATATTGYTASVAGTVASIAVTPTATTTGTTITVNGAKVSSGAASSPIALTTGANTINVVVTAQDGVTQKTYTITVGNGDNNAYLSSLTVKTATLSPAFAFKTLAYTANVANATSSVTVTPSVLDATASSIKVNGTAVANKTATGPIALAPGANNINIVIIAQDGVTTEEYTVTITRAASTDAALAGLAISSGTLSPAFATATSSYTASVANTVSSLTVTPATADPTATVTVNGTAVTSGTASNAIALAVGNNAIITVVTAEDGVTTDTYTVTVTRAPSSNDNLANLAVNAGTLTPAFATGITGYTVSLAGTATAIKITPTATDPTATISVNGTTVASGTTSAAITLNTGANTINVMVTAQDGVTKQTYTIIVGKGDNDAYLSNLTVKTATLSPGFAFKTLAYTSNVPNATSSVTVTPTLFDATASSLTVNGTAVANKATSGPIALAVGANVINIAIIAQDGVTTETYAVTMTRAASGADGYDPISVTAPTETTNLIDDGIKVHQGVSPNGDGINDFLQIDNISQYPENKLSIINRNGQLIYEVQGYDNSSKVFDGHSNKNGQMQLPGTYFYQLDYMVNGISKHKTGFIVLKY